MMADARGGFKDLHQIAGLGLDTTALSGDLARVERRVVRYKRTRAAFVSATGVAVIAAAAMGALQWPSDRGAAPAFEPSESPSASAPTEDAVVDPECRPATVLEGTPVEGFPADEEWFDPTPDTVPCSRWGTSDPALDLSFESHPDLVVVNTVDNTMVRAYYRTSRDALGVYGSLGSDFAIPDPDPSWPPNAVVLIDAASGEALANYQLPGYAEPDPSMFTWSDWWEGYLSGPLDVTYLPDGYSYAPGASTPQGSADDVVEPQVYTSSDDGPAVTIRLVTAADARSERDVTGADEILDEGGYAPGSVLTRDEASGLSTVDIPVPEELHVLLEGKDLELLEQFVDALTTVEQG